MMGVCSDLRKFRGRIVHSDVEGSITRYYKGLAIAFDKLRATGQPGIFEPSFELPELDDRFEEFFSVASIKHTALRPYEGRALRLIDLMQDPGTHTTKTLASLLIVARAVQHIRRTGERIAIVTPSSGNKATALRSAVERAIYLGLVAPDQLRILTLTPFSNLYKMRHTRLSSDPELSRLNPVFVVDADDGHRIKQIGKDFADTFADRLLESHGLRAWYSLDLRNYKVADALRAFSDYEARAVEHSNTAQIHAHAVSSAYGLLGFAFGNEILAEAGILTADQRRPGYLLVQHLATCDMVLHLQHGNFERSGIPSYDYDSKDCLYKQSRDAHFPRRTLAMDEVIDPTFYTREPATSVEMTALIGRDGGTGIVVSLLECVERLGLVRALLRDVVPRLDGDPRTYLEWSLAMAVTGVLNAIDRNLIDGFDEVVLHASGFYCKADYEHLPPGAYCKIADHHEIFANLRW